MTSYEGRVHLNGTAETDLSIDDLDSTQWIGVEVGLAMGEAAQQGIEGTVIVVLMEHDRAGSRSSASATIENGRVTFHGTSAFTRN